MAYKFFYFSFEHRINSTVLKLTLYPYRYANVYNEERMLTLAKKEAKFYCVQMKRTSSERYLPSDDRFIRYYKEAQQKSLLEKVIPFENEMKKLEKYITKQIPHLGSTMIDEAITTNNNKTKKTRKNSTASPKRGRETSFKATVVPLFYVIQERDHTRLTVIDDQTIGDLYVVSEAFFTFLEKFGLSYFKSFFD
mmetsp:Transcript_443/g.527  ORF Transcript_443/g.527 Transcript_443/m.527 type:complete len:194 (-) Transcript_443:1049-1630(-)